MNEIGSADKQINTKHNKSSSFAQKLIDYFTEYCNNSRIHGIKYVGEQNRTIIEKIWWCMAMLAALCFCVILIKTTYHKWENSPVIVSFATKETPIWQIPFPAVTICPQTKSVPKMFNYTDFFYKKEDKNLMSEADELKFSYVSALCDYHREINFNVSDFVNDQIFDVFEEVGPNFISSISECVFMGLHYNCSALFTPIITDEGLCYSFNILHRDHILSERVKHHNDFHSISKSLSEWSLEHGYSKKAAKNTYPKRALYAGALFAFELTIQTPDEELDFMCSKSVQGYKVQIHHPSMLPRVKQQHFRLPLDQGVLAAIMPTMITTSDKIKSYSPERRQCFFSSERNLKYFKIYTQQNCQIECKTNFTLEKCGCVDFYMPRETTTKICGAPMKHCMLKAEEALLSEGIENQLRRFEDLPPEDNAEYRMAQKCNCMPDCTSMTYEIENSPADWDWVRSYQFKRGSVNFNKSTTNMSYLQIFFKANQFITSERNELFGPTDFLANCGGLLGLFTGFSVLSLVEILYYLTLRLYCNIRLFGSKYWTGKK